jgi:hypothetical protein
MKLEIAGRDRSADLGSDIASAAAARKCPALEALIAREMPITKLGACADTDCYLATHIELTHARNCVEPREFDTPGRNGMCGGILHAVRRFLWKILRYQYDWMAFRQNAINIQSNYQLKFEHEDRVRIIGKLEERIRKLESLLKEKKGGDGGQ